MSDNQKHKVATDALETLGTCPIPEDSGRDAIHLAVEPVIAGVRLEPGLYVKLIDGKAYPAYPLSDAVGIVDPFVKQYIAKGQRFWLVVLPRTITSLRHVWSHPAFPESETLVTSQGNDTVPAPEPEQSMAKAWMKEYCDSIGERYEYVMEGAKEFLNSGAYLYGEKDSGNLEGASLPPEFWDKYQAIMKEEVPVKDRRDFFTCSC